MTDEKSMKAADITGAKATAGMGANDTAAGIARVRRLGFDPQKLGDVEAEQLRRLGIDSETFERKAVTYKGLIKEFGRPLGPQVYNGIAVAGWGGVPSNRGDLSIMTLQDQYLSPRKPDESEESFNARLEKHRARRAKVEKVLADAEGGKG